MTSLSRPTTVRVGPQGRIVIPASYRKTYGIKRGHKLFLYPHVSGFSLERPEVSIERLKSKVKKIPSDIRLVDELISDRRREASFE